MRKSDPYLTIEFTGIDFDPGILQSDIEKSFFQYLPARSAFREFSSDSRQILYGYTLIVSEDQSLGFLGFFRHRLYKDLFLLFRLLHSEYFMMTSRVE